MFKYIIGLVKDPQFVLDSCEIALAYQDFEDIDLDDLVPAMEDLFGFHLDMLMMGR